MQGKIAAVIPEEAPDLGLLPLPPLTQRFQSQYGAVLSILNSRCQEGERITLVPKNGMTPQIQSGIRLTELVALFHQPFGNISGHANKPILGRGVNIAFTTLLARAFDNPVGDPIGQDLCARFQCVGDIAQHLKFVHDLYSLLTVFNLQNAFETNNAANPGTYLHSVPVAAVAGKTFTKGSTGYQPQKIDQKAFCMMGNLISENLNPVKFLQTFQGCFLLPRNIKNR